MSLKTWKEEFYSPVSKVKKADALEHSIKKWSGLAPENLQKHGVTVDEWGTLQYWETECLEVFAIDSGTCALCKFYIDFKTKDYADECEACPIVLITGEPCDGLPGARRDKAPYCRWMRSQNPKPMITLLKKVKRALAKRDSKPE